MGQLIASHHVADGVNAGQIGALAVIHHDATLLVQSQTQGLGVNAGEVCFSSGGHQHLLAVGVLLPAVQLINRPQQSAVFLDPQHFPAGFQGNAPVFQVLHKDPHRLGLLVGHDLRQHLHHRHLRAVGGKGAGQLQADDAAAHHHHAAG